MNAKKLTFTGPDASLEISLFEYGLIVSNEPHEDGSGTHFVIYKIGDDAYGTGHISEEQVNGYVLGKEFMSEEDIEKFLDFAGGEPKEDWMKCSLDTKLYDLIMYWGCENIMGTDYYPWTEKFIRREYKHLF